LVAIGEGNAARRAAGVDKEKPFCHPLRIILRGCRCIQWLQ
jgi:hypothetical protein